MRMLDGSKRQRLWWQWLLATVLGWMVAPAIAFLGLVLRQPISGFAAMFFAGFVAIGVAQWLVIRNHLRSMQGCAFTGFLPGIVSGTLIATQLWVELSGPALLAYWLGSIMMGGFLLGVVQWWWLRSPLPRAGQWIVISTLAWMLGLVLGLLGAFGVTSVLSVRADLAQALWGVFLGVCVGWGVTAIAVGLMTGIYLMQALPPQPSQRSQ